jgi:hypothetical protein
MSVGAADQDAAGEHLEEPLGVHGVVPDREPVEPVGDISDTWPSVGPILEGGVDHHQRRLRMTPQLGECAR